MEMDMEWKWSRNGAQFVKIVWIGLDLGQSVDLKPRIASMNITSAFTGRRHEALIRSILL